MARSIRIKKNYIPIPVIDEIENEDGELVEEVVHELRFYRTDENLDKIYKQGEVIEKLSDEVDENDSESGREFIRDAFDSIFQEGDFDKLYEINPSSLIMLEYFIHAVIIIREELNDASGVESLQKYLK